MAKHPRSPLAPKRFPKLPALTGVKFAAAMAGVRYQGRRDVMLALLPPGTAVAGAFTRSATRSAPVRDCERKLTLKVPKGSGAAILVNSGNANAFTGKAGDKAVRTLTGAVAKALGVPATRVFSASTGVIGEPLPTAPILQALPSLVASLSEKSAAEAAEAIMTTDTFPKGAVQEITVEGEKIRLFGFAKGSGMIAPDMATMLVYLFTDAKIAAPLLQKTLSGLLGETFNAITVDGDTSTSDSVLLAATGQSAAPPIKSGAPLAAFRAALHALMRDLAQQVVRDGEGAQKFIEVAVTGAANGEDARRVAFAIAHSPLVKTAVAGEDPNWGRIVMAVGKSGAKADRDRLKIHLGPHLLAEKGARAAGYSEAKAAAYMKKAEIVIAVDLGLGRGAAQVWTCDLTHRYIDINADYRS